MSTLIFGNTKIVTKTQEDLGGPEVLTHTFLAAYEELRRATPGGDLHIHLYVEASSPEEVGVTLLPRCMECDGRGKVLDAPGDVLGGRAYETVCEICKGTGYEPRQTL